MSTRREGRINMGTRTGSGNLKDLGTVPRHPAEPFQRYSESFTNFFVKRFITGPLAEKFEEGGLRKASQQELYYLSATTSQQPIQEGTRPNVAS